MVSHDRDLLNDVCDHIVHIDQQKLVTYTGNYDRFERTRAERLEHDAAQQAKIAAQRKHMQAFVDRFTAKASKARQAQSRIKMIEKLGRSSSVPIEERDRLQLSAARAARPADRDARRGRGRLRDGPPVLRKLDLRLDMDDRIALLGPERQRQVDLHPSCCRIACSRAQGKLKRTPRAARRLLLAGPGGRASTTRRRRSTT